MDEDFWAAILQRVTNGNIFSRILSIDSEPAVAKGENYLSNVSRLKIRVMLRSGRKANISLIVKELPDGEGKQKFVKKFGPFRREIQVYQTVLKEMDNLMNEVEDKNDKLWPDMIGYLPYSTLIFEDLEANNYKVPPRQECQDLNHGMLTMVEMARFHALSKVLIKRGLLQMDDLPKYFLCHREHFKKGALSSIRRMGEVMQHSWGQEWVNLGIRLTNCTEINVKSIVEVNKCFNQKFHVMNHGDPWTSNMMFKYSVYEDKPIALKFIDYQLCHVNSFAWDLTYYLFSSVEPDLRRENMSKFLKKYAESLSSALEELSIPDDEIPTFDEITAEMARVSPFRVVVMCFFHAIMTYKFTDAYDMNRSMKSKDGEPPKDECFLDDRFKARVGPDIRQFAEDGLI